MLRWIWSFMHGDSLFCLTVDLTDIDMDLEHCNPNRRVGELPPCDRSVRITTNHHKHWLIGLILCFLIQYMQLEHCPYQLIVLNFHQLEVYILVFDHTLSWYLKYMNLWKHTSSLVLVLDIDFSTYKWHTYSEVALDYNILMPIFICWKIDLHGQLWKLSVLIFSYI